MTTGPTTLDEQTTQPTTVQQAESQSVSPTNSEPLQMEFEVLLFAVLREAAATDRIRVSLVREAADGAPTVGDLLARCGELHPVLQPWLPYIKVAVNCAYVDGDRQIHPGDEIALLPPVAGGAV